MAKMIDFYIISILTILVSIAPRFLWISDPGRSNLDAIAEAGELKVGWSGSLGLYAPNYL